MSSTKNGIAVNRIADAQKYFDLIIYLKLTA